MQGIIYKIRDPLTTREYIGQTIRSLKQRLREHLTCPGCYIINAVIRKRGLDALEIEVLYQGDVTRDELNSLETFFIKKFNTLYPNGMNLTLGGDATEFSSASKMKMRDSRRLMIERNLKEIGTAFKDTHRQRMSASAYDRWARGDGVIRTPEHNKKISISMLKYWDDKKKGVCYD